MMVPWFELQKTWTDGAIRVEYQSEKKCVW